MRLRPHIVAAIAFCLVMTAEVAATSFVVPTDDELSARSLAIVIATAEGSYVLEQDGTIETIYELRVERSIKGPLRPEELLRVTALGGVIGERGVIVPGAAHFRQGERALLFLTRDERGRWRTTEMTLGKFRFMTSTLGERLLVREMEDVAGWDHAGRPHRERVRREAGFLRFLEERTKGQSAADDYSVDSSEVTIAPEDERFSIQAEATSYPAATYTDFVNNQPIRWPSMSPGKTYYKRSDQNIAGAADGGVGVIQNGLAAWTNECGSVIVLSYGGQISTASQNHDATNVVEFNDPQSRISGSWTGSGTVAIAFLSFAGSHTFLGQSWLNITDGDVVFQNGYTASNSSFPSAMTHELGHTLGWRHSNQNHATGGACNSAVEECTSAAIMNSSVSANYGYTLQPWDVNAAQSVYPGGNCGPLPPACVPPVITAQPPSSTVAPGASATLTVSASGTTPLSYQWYVGTSGNTSNPIPATGPSLTVTPGTTTSYWVRVSNACGTVNSGTATVTVTTGALASGAAARLYLVTPCRVIDTRDSQPLYGSSARLVQMTGVCGIPSTARSVVINVSAVSPSGTGTLTVYPGTGAQPPNTSTVSYRLNRTRANNTVMRLSSDGRLSVYNAGPSVHFVIDVTAYFQ